MSLSVVVPAYNEEKRIGYFLPSLIKVLDKNKLDYELVIVVDGSKDRSLDIIKKIKNNRKNIRIISYKPNKGKGYALKKGILASHKNYVLFIDADGSIPADQIVGMYEHLKKHNVVIADRNLRESKVKRKFFRKVLAWIFNHYVALLFNMPKYDYLCGFKGFKTRLAKDTFNDMVSKRWIFDVELLYRLKKNNIYRMPIKWNYKKYSNMGLKDPFLMFFQLILLRFRLK